MSQNFMLIITKCDKMKFLKRKLRRTIISNNKNWSEDHCKLILLEYSAPLGDTSVELKNRNLLLRT